MDYHRLITLENSRISVGILADVGGRIVRLCTPGGPNLLKADPREWNRPPLRNRTITARTPFKAWNGHIVWLGPQNEWWMHQNVSESRRRRRADWPPDPWLTYGYYTATHRTSSSITLQGPHSPVSGVRLEKTIALHENGSVDIGVSATNISNETVAWDLWPNTRVDGYSRCYVPIATNGVERIAGHGGANGETMDWQICNGYFTFSPRQPSKDATQRCAKAFLQPNRGIIAAFCGHECFLIHFARHSRDAIHPQQSQVELFNCLTHNRSQALLELEQHAPYRTLEPQESMQTRQRWEVVPYSGGNNHPEHTAFLDGMLSPRDTSPQA